MYTTVKMLQMMKMDLCLKFRYVSIPICVFRKVCNSEQTILNRKWKRKFHLSSFKNQDLGRTCFNFCLYFYTFLKTIQILKFKNNMQQKSIIIWRFKVILTTILQNSIIRCKRLVSNGVMQSSHPAYFKMNILYEKAK